MKDLICFLPVSVEKELPKEDGAYFTIRKGALIGQWYAIDKNDPLEHGWDNYPDKWLKPLSLPELMEEAIHDYKKYYESNSISGNTILEEKIFVNEWLTQKGII